MALAQLSFSKSLPAGKTVAKDAPHGELLAVALNAEEGTLVAWGLEMLRA